MNEGVQRRLLDRLRPDTSRTGRVRRLLATTHDLDAEFFDSDFLCTALSIAQADFAGHSGQVALQRMLAGLDYCGVLCEARAYEHRPSLRTVVHPVTLRGARLHAKLVVVEYDHAVRVLVGSANLTAAGYRHNREVLGEHLAYSDKPKNCAQAAAIVRSAREVLEVFSDRAAEFLRHMDAVFNRLETWAASESAGPSQVVWSDGTRPLWSALLDRWPPGALVNRLRIVSPFWSEDGSRDTPLRRLLGELRSREALADRCAVELFGESAPLADGGFVAKESPAVYYADFPGVSVRVLPVDPQIAKSDLDVKADLTATRCLHAKLVVLQSSDQALAYAGSGNFTRNGFGLRHAAAGSTRVTANIEAGWVFDLPLASVVNVLPPRANDGRDVPSLDAPRNSVSDEDEEQASAFWPEPLLGAELTPASDRDVLALKTDWAATTPSGWTVHAPTAYDDEPVLGAPLFTTAAGAAQVTTELSPSVLESILRERHIVVACERGHARFPVNVAAGDARHRLPLSASVTQPGESDLLAYYQGLITFDDLYPDPEGGSGSDSEKRPEPRATQGVDKSRIQAYQLRAFVDALPGLKRDLLDARGSEGALFQAFRGEVSPVALARHVVQQVASGSRSVTAGAFQLAELVALLRSIRTHAPEGVEHFAETCDQARREIEEHLQALRQSHTNELGTTSSFARYAAKLEDAAR